jgi:hypothetical protein
MLTVFSTPKPFIGHSNIIQRNALKSWTQLHPDVEVILFGDEEGAAEVCAEMGIRHEPQVRRHEKGPKYLDFFFDRAQEIARHNILCYANCDIVLMSDFRKAVERVASRWTRFLMVGRNWGTKIEVPLEFQSNDWEPKLQAFARQHGQRRSATWIDYFVFPRGLYLHKIPQFVIGRPSWDPWLIWWAISSGATVVDASPVVTAVHQNHDYSYHPQGAKGVGFDDLARRNQKLAGGWTHWQTTNSASYVLTPQGVRRRYARRWFVPALQRLEYSASVVWFKALGVSRPVRHRLGLRKKTDLARDTYVP